MTARLKEYQFKVVTKCGSYYSGTIKATSKLQAMKHLYGYGEDSRPSVWEEGKPGVEDDGTPDCDA